MTTYLISFPSSGMAHLTDEQLAAASRDTRRLVDEAKAAGAWVFGGAIDDRVSPESVAADGAVTSGVDAAVRPFDGGVTLLDLPSLEAARTWAAKFAAACGCPQEVRAFHYDPAS